MPVNDKDLISWIYLNDIDEDKPFPDLWNSLSDEPPYWWWKKISDEISLSDWLSENLDVYPFSIGLPVVALSFILFGWLIKRLVRKARGPLNNKPIETPIRSPRKQQLRPPKTEDDLSNMSTFSPNTPSHLSSQTSAAVKTRVMAWIDQSRPYQNKLRKRLTRRNAEGKEYPLSMTSKTTIKSSHMEEGPNFDSQDATEFNIESSSFNSLQKRRGSDVITTGVSVTTQYASQDNALDTTVCSMRESVYDCTKNKGTERVSNCLQPSNDESKVRNDTNLSEESASTHESSSSISDELSSEESGNEESNLSGTDEMNCVVLSNTRQATGNDGLKTDRKKGPQKSGSKGKSVYSSQPSRTRCAIMEGRYVNKGQSQQMLRKGSKHNSLASSGHRRRTPSIGKMNIKKGKHKDRTVTPDPNQVTENDGLETTCETQEGVEDMGAVRYLIDQFNLDETSGMIYPRTMTRNMPAAVPSRRLCDSSENGVPDTEALKSKRYSNSNCSERRLTNVNQTLGHNMFQNIGVTSTASFARGPCEWEKHGIVIGHSDIHSIEGNKRYPLCSTHEKNTAHGNPALLSVASPPYSQVTPPCREGFLAFSGVAVSNHNPVSPPKGTYSGNEPFGTIPNQFLKNENTFAESLRRQLYLIPSKKFSHDNDTSPIPAVPCGINPSTVDSMGPVGKTNTRGTKTHIFPALSSPTCLESRFLKPANSFNDGITTMGQRNLNTSVQNSMSPNVFFTKHSLNVNNDSLPVSHYSHSPPYLIKGNEMPKHPSLKDSHEKNHAHMLWSKWKHAGNEMNYKLIGFVMRRRPSVERFRPYKHPREICQFQAPAEKRSSFYGKRATDEHSERSGIEFSPNFFQRKDTVSPQFTSNVSTFNTDNALHDKMLCDRETGHLVLPKHRQPQPPLDNILSSEYMAEPGLRRKPPPCMPKLLKQRPRMFRYEAPAQQREEFSTKKSESSSIHVDVHERISRDTCILARDRNAPAGICDAKEHQISPSMSSVDSSFSPISSSDTSKLSSELERFQFTETRARKIKPNHLSELNKNKTEYVSNTLSQTQLSETNVVQYLEKYSKKNLKTLQALHGGRHIREKSSRLRKQKQGIEKDDEGDGDVDVDTKDYLSHVKQNSRFRKERKTDTFLNSKMNSLSPIKNVSQIFETRDEDTDAASDAENSTLSTEQTKWNSSETGDGGMGKFHTFKGSHQKLAKGFFKTEQIKNRHNDTFTKPRASFLPRPVHKDKQLNIVNKRNRRRDGPSSKENNMEMTNKRHEETLSMDVVQKQAKQYRREDKKPPNRTDVDYDWQAIREKGSPVSSYEDLSASGSHSSVDSPVYSSVNMELLYVSGMSECAESDPEKRKRPKHFDTRNRGMQAKQRDYYDKYISKADVGVKGQTSYGFSISPQSDKSSITSSQKDHKTLSRCYQNSRGEVNRSRVPNPFEDGENSLSREQETDSWMTSASKYLQKWKHTGQENLSRTVQHGSQKDFQKSDYTLRQDGTTSSRLSASALRQHKEDECKSNDLPSVSTTLDSSVRLKHVCCALACRLSGSQAQGKSGCDMCNASQTLSHQEYARSIHKSIYKNPYSKLPQVCKRHATATNNLRYTEAKAVRHGKENVNASTNRRGSNIPSTASSPSKKSDDVKHKVNIRGKEARTKSKVSAMKPQPSRRVETRQRSQAATLTTKSMTKEADTDLKRSKRQNENDECARGVDVSHSAVYAYLSKLQKSPIYHTNDHAEAPLSPRLEKQGSAETQEKKMSHHSFQSLSKGSVEIRGQKVSHHSCQSPSKVSSRGTPSPTNESPVSVRSKTDRDLKQRHSADRVHTLLYQNLTSPPKKRPPPRCKHDNLPGYLRPTHSYSLKVCPPVKEGSAHTTGTCNNKTCPPKKSLPRHSSETQTFTSKFRRKCDIAVDQKSVISVSKSKLSPSTCEHGVVKNKANFHMTSGEARRISVLPPHVPRCDGRQSKQNAESPNQSMNKMLNRSSNGEYVHDSSESSPNQMQKQTIDLCELPDKRPSLANCVQDDQLNRDVLNFGSAKLDVEDTSPKWTLKSTCRTNSSASRSVSPCFPNVETPDQTIKMAKITPPYVVITRRPTSPQNGISKPMTYSPIFEACYKTTNNKNKTATAKGETPLITKQLPIPTQILVKQTKTSLRRVQVSHKNRGRPSYPLKIFRESQSNDNSRVNKEGAETGPWIEGRLLTRQPRGHRQTDAVKKGSDEVKDKTQLPRNNELSKPSITKRPIIVSHYSPTSSNINTLRGSQRLESSPRTRYVGLANLQHKTSGSPKSSPVTEQSATIRFTEIECTGDDMCRRTKLIRTGDNSTNSAEHSLFEVSPMRTDVSTSEGKPMAERNVGTKDTIRQSEQICRTPIQGHLSPEGQNMSLTVKIPGVTSPQPQTIRRNYSLKYLKRHLNNFSYFRKFKDLNYDPRTLITVNDIRENQSVRKMETHLNPESRNLTPNSNGDTQSLYGCKVPTPVRAVKDLTLFRQQMSLQNSSDELQPLGHSDKFIALGRSRKNETGNSEKQGTDIKERTSDQEWKIAALSQEFRNKGPCVPVRTNLKRAKTEFPHLSLSGRQKVYRRASSMFMKLTVANQKSPSPLKIKYPDKLNQNHSHSPREKPTNEVNDTLQEDQANGSCHDFIDISESNTLDKNSFNSLLDHREVPKIRVGIKKKKRNRRMSRNAGLNWFHPVKFSQTARLSRKNRSPLRSVNSVCGKGVRTKRSPHRKLRAGPLNRHIETKQLTPSDSESSETIDTRHKTGNFTKNNNLAEQVVLGQLHQISDAQNSKIVNAKTQIRENDTKQALAGFETKLRHLNTEGWMTTDNLRCVKAKVENEDHESPVSKCSLSQWSSTPSWSSVSSPGTEDQPVFAGSEFHRLDQMQTENHLQTDSRYFNNRAIDNESCSRKRRYCEYQESKLRQSSCMTTVSSRMAHSGEELEMRNPLQTATCYNSCDTDTVGHPGRQFSCPVERENDTILPSTKAERQQSTEVKNARIAMLQMLSNFQSDKSPMQHSVFKGTQQIHTSPSSISLNISSSFSSTSIAHESLYHLITTCSHTQHTTSPEQSAPASDDVPFRNQTIDSRAPQLYAQTPKIYRGSGHVLDELTGSTHCLHLATATPPKIIRVKPPKENSLVGQMVKMFETKLQFRRPSSTNT